MRPGGPVLDEGRRPRAGSGRCRLSDPAVGLIVFCAALAYFNSTLHLTLELHDEGFLFYNISRVAHGEIPHRDFAEVYGPGFYALTAPILKIFGDRIYPIRELVAVVRAAAVAFAYLIARSLVPRSFALMAAVMAAAYWGRVVWNLNAPYAALFTISLCMLSLVLLLAGQTQGRRSAYVWAGLACGGALLFKWSLAAASAYGMVLAICASAMLRDPPPGGSRTRARWVLLAWASVGMMIVLPFASRLTLADYLLHLAPIHAVVVSTGVYFARFGDGRRVLAQALPLVSRYGAGFVVLPLCAGAVHLWWGSLDDLLYDVVYRPLRYRNYPSPVGSAELAQVLHLVCWILWIGVGLAWLRGARKGAALLAALGCLVAPAAYPALAPDWNPSEALKSLMHIQPSGVNFLLAVLLFVFLARRRPADSEPRLDAFIALLLFQEMMIFQIFPRAGYNVTMILGALAPSIAWLSHRAYTLAMAGGFRETFARRSAAFGLSALLPLLLVGQIIYETLASATAPEEGALHSPALAGIRPQPHPAAPAAYRQFDSLIRHLETLQPLDAPVFAVPNEFMIYFASGREHLFRDHALALFLAGWGLLPEHDRETPSPAAMIERLQRTPEAIVITRRADATQAHFAALFPSVSRYIQQHYRVEKEIGNYRLMRLASPAPNGDS